MLDSTSFGSLVSNNGVTNLGWDKTECEHLIDVQAKGQDSTAVYPTKRFFRERLDLAKKINLAGVAIWDIAQGLESFLYEF
jgi:spore germination protein YaaH